MQAERGTHFDADLLDLFFACEQEIWRIRRQWSDVDPVVA
jgi:hypothetical protein